MDRLLRLTPALVATVLAGWAAWLFARSLPPFVDLPQHAWTLAMLRHPEAYADAFVTTLRPWHTNALWFELDRVLAPFVDPEGSLALASFLAVALLPVALAAWAGALGRSAGLALVVGWVVAWTRPLHWGFFHYALSLPTAVFALALHAVALRRGPGWRGARELGVAALVVVVYLLHAQTWAFLLVALVVQAAAGREGRAARRLGAVALAALPSLGLFVPFLLADLATPRAGEAPFLSLAGGIRPRFGDTAVDLRFLPENAAATVKGSKVDEGLVAAVVLAAVGGFVRAGLRRDDPGRGAVLPLGLLALLALAAYLFLPMHVLGQFQIASRMAPWIVLALVPVAAPVSRPRTHGVALALAAAAALTMASLQARTFRGYAAEVRPLLAMMAKMEPGKTVTVWARSRSSRWALGAVYTHIGALYAERTLGRALFSFAEFRPNPVVYRDPVGHPRMVAGEESRAWCAVRAGDGVDVDYVLTRYDRDAASTCGSVEQYRDALHEVARERGWALYEVVAPLEAARDPACRCPTRAPRRGRARSASERAATP